jgi:glycosyltransferase involved in cell wall biosynthesis
VTKTPLVTFERRDPDAEILVVTNGWPHEEDETYCVFIKRQVDSVVAGGARCDVLFIRGYRTKVAYLAAAVRLATWALRSRNYKLVHAHSGEAALAAAFYWRTSLLVSYLGDDLLGTPRSDGRVPLLARVRRQVFRQLARLATRTITKSREMEGVLPARVRRRNTVLPNGVDVAVFRPTQRGEARRALAWDECQHVALFAADPAVPRKRFWLAAAAVDQARRVMPDIELRVARGVPPDRIPLLMSAADCLLLTSSIEGSPNVVKEAAMCNLPVVATAVGDVRDLLDGVEPSFVCDDTVPDLANALVRCFRDGRRSNGREILSKLDAQVVAQRLLHLYDGMMRPPPSRAAFCRFRRKI